ncbi:hypothetical protein [Paenibacillus sp.]|jgi:hypothetical protein|uniref:hypothetical protein n=1 Tax=Paenibacillus sp. TaxID=58172 RepID=UPI00282E5A87|nr:hypothetical protein [Paenibacillus sp.]MDR0271189.1 hypothetical protein [Paenibacillus sp.]
MRNRNIIFTGLLLFVFIIGGCGTSKPEKKEIVGKAKAVAVEYFKENYNVDVIFTKMVVRPRYISSDVELYGHVKDDKEQEFVLLVDYRTYEVGPGVISNGFDEKYLKNERVGTDPILNGKSHE